MYRIIAGVIFLAGIIITLFLWLFGKKNELFCTLLIINVMGCVASYFFSYRRLLYLANQKNYKCVQVDAILQNCSAFLQVFVLMAVQMGRFAGGQAVADFSVPAISESFK